MLHLRASSDGRGFEQFCAWLDAAGYVKYGEYTEGYGRSVAFLETPSEEPDVVFAVTEDKESPDDGYLHLSATGYHRLFGLMLFDNVRGAGVSVEVSGISAAMKELGSDTITTRDVLISFPGFSNLEATLAKLGIRRR